jgi:hypothetical protein
MKYTRMLVEYSSLRLEHLIHRGLEETFDDFSVSKVIEEGGTLPGVRGLGEA